MVFVEHRGRTGGSGPGGGRTASRTRWRRDITIVDSGDTGTTEDSGDGGVRPAGMFAHSRGDRDTFCRHKGHRFDSNGEIGRCRHDGGMKSKWHEGGRRRRARRELRNSWSLVDYPMRTSGTSPLGHRLGMVWYGMVWSVSVKYRVQFRQLQPGVVPDAEV